MEEATTVMEAREDIRHLGASSDMAAAQERRGYCMCRKDTVARAGAPVAARPIFLGVPAATETGYILALVAILLMGAAEGEVAVGGGSIRMVTALRAVSQGEEGVVVVQAHRVAPPAAVEAGAGMRHILIRQASLLPAPA